VELINQCEAVMNLRVKLGRFHDYLSYYQLLRIPLYTIRLPRVGSAVKKNSAIIC
jgi:hypothetical protein